MWILEALPDLGYQEKRFLWVKAGTSFSFGRLEDGMQFCPNESHRAYVSRRQASFHVEKMDLSVSTGRIDLEIVPKFFIENLSAKVDTRVNGEIVKRAELNHGDVVRFGTSKDAFKVSWRPLRIVNALKGQQEQQGLKDLCAKVDAQIVSGLDSNPTHVVLTDEPSLRLLHALIGGKQVVHTSFLEDLGKQKPFDFKFPSETDHLLKLENLVINNGPPRADLFAVKPERQSLLRGRIVVFIDEKMMRKYEVIMIAAGASSACLISTIQRVAFTSRIRKIVNPLIFCETEVPDCVSTAAKTCGLRLCSEEDFLLAVLTLDVETYLGYQADQSLPQESERNTDAILNTNSISNNIATMNSSTHSLLQTQTNDTQGRGQKSYMASLIASLNTQTTTRPRRAADLLNDSDSDADEEESLMVAHSLPSHGEIPSSRTPVTSLLDRTRGTTQIRPTISQYSVNQSNLVSSQRDKTTYDFGQYKKRDAVDALPSNSLAPTGLQPGTSTEREETKTPDLKPSQILVDESPPQEFRLPAPMEEDVIMEARETAKPEMRVPSEKQNGSMPVRKAKKVLAPMGQEELDIEIGKAAAQLKQAARTESIAAPSTNFDLENEECPMVVNFSDSILRDNNPPPHVLPSAGAGSGLWSEYRNHAPNFRVFRKAGTELPIVERSHLHQIISRRDMTLVGENDGAEVWLKPSKQDMFDETSDEDKEDADPAGSMGIGRRRVVRGRGRGRGRGQGQARQRDIIRMLEEDSENESVVIPDVKPARIRGPETNVPIEVDDDEIQFIAAKASEMGTEERDTRSRKRVLVLESEDESLPTRTSPRKKQRTVAESEPDVATEDQVIDSIFTGTNNNYSVIESSKKDLDSEDELNSLTRRRGRGRGRGRL